MTQPPGGPYGTPPLPGTPPPGPYGPQGYGVPPQPGQQAGPPYGGYGYPQGMPYAGGPGMPAGPPPPQKSRTGLTIAIIAGATVLLGGVLWAAVRAADGGGFTDDGPRYELTKPQTLVDGKYTLEKNQTEVQREEQNLQESFPSDITAVAARYLRSGDPVQGGLVISGGYGDLEDSPEEIRADMLGGMEDGAQGEVAQQRRDMRPQGADGPVVTCETLKVGEAAATVYIPACAWADGSTAATVAKFGATYRSLDNVDLEKFARVTAQIRDEMTVPAP